MLNRTLYLNNLTIQDALLQLGTTCNDFILKCQWAGKSFPCFQNDKYFKWVTSMSHLGVCCSFNNQLNKPNHSLFSTNTFGIYGGLSVIGTGRPQVADGKSGVIFSAGYMVIAILNKNIKKLHLNF